MILEEDSVFKLSYGMFYLGCVSDDKKNICVVNTVMQVTQEPLKLSVTILKTNFTSDLILKAKQFSVSVMGVNANFDTIKKLGTVSGREKDKLDDVLYSVDPLGNPIIKEGCVCTYTCTVDSVVDLGTHFLFISTLQGAENICDDEVLTYEKYRAMRNNPDKETWQCSVCHYIYEGNENFNDLPDDYICPVCKKPKSVFVKV